MITAVKWSRNVQLTSVWLTPFLFCLVCIGFSHFSFTVAEASKLIIPMIIIGLILSLPFWFILWAAAFLINRLAMSYITKKLFLSLIGAALSVLPFIILSTPRMAVKGQIALPVCYAAVTVISIWLYQLPFVRKVDAASL